ncbi:beta-N-acetylhexosaminidase [Zhouia spongiae]|uniref:beta-N-acetylhexosaminidase n=1 Tax=Zhouia spongiae TaxID=2202721 RepID=A0ABY3YHN0_9FLAO|nr:beta-N-acetylhexosaminidase [Zhouia spongiae]UNY97238.1 beta-N-acetylhexosaminidase [Zhouia spongiae]
MKTTYTLMIFSVILLKATIVLSQENRLAIIPEPNYMELKEGVFEVKHNLKMNSSVEFQEIIDTTDYVKDVLEEVFKVSITREAKSSSDIIITRDHTLAEEAYVIDIRPDRIHIKVKNTTGFFYATQTLRQILFQSRVFKGSKTIPICYIKDEPRFSYRALMLDPARHFLPFEDIKKFIRAMSFYKFNKLHLHLTDDQGWRMEIKKYPELTSVGAWRDETEGDGVKHGGFYSQSQMKELVRYAKAYHIDIIPEIDMPGHSMSVLAAYPQLACFLDDFKVRTTPGVDKNLLCAGNDKVPGFYDDIIREVTTIFPYNKIHIGGDEAPTDNWEQCLKCQQKIKREGLKDEHGLMSAFFNKMNQILKKYNRQPMLWYEENVTSYPEGSTVFLWRKGTAERVVKATGEQGLKLICAPGEYAYLDYPESAAEKRYTFDWMQTLPLHQVYDFDPGYGLSAEDQRHIIGIEGCVWGERVYNINRAFYMTYPRALALAEAGWTATMNKSWERFSCKLQSNLVFLLNEGINFRVPFELFNED